METIRKDVIELFWSEILSITIITNFIETDFLDDSFNLDIFFPFRKQNNTSFCTHFESNLAPSITKQKQSMTTYLKFVMPWKWVTKPIYESAVKSNHLLKMQEEAETVNWYGSSHHIV